MFDVGFSELVVIAVVALIVVGPERLPRVARTAGALLGRLQRYVSEVKAEVSREIHLEEMKRLQQDINDKAKALEHEASAGLAEAESTVRQSIAEAEHGIKPDHKEQA